MQNWSPLNRRTAHIESDDSLQGLLKGQKGYQLDRIKSGQMDESLRTEDVDDLASRLAAQTRIPDPGYQVSEWNATVVDTPEGERVKYWIGFASHAQVAHLMVPRYVAGSALDRYGNGVEFSIPRKDRSAEDIRNIAEPILEGISSSVGESLKLINDFNSTIEEGIREALAQRKEEILGRDQFLDEINRRT
jgi:hypothetical protein